VSLKAWGFAFCTPIGKDHGKDKPTSLRLSRPVEPFRSSWTVSIMTLVNAITLPSGEAAQFFRSLGYVAEVDAGVPGVRGRHDVD